MIVQAPSRGDLSDFIKDPRTLRAFEALFRAIGYRPVVLKSADYTIQPSDSGSVLVATAADVVFTLPPTDNGLWYTCVFKVPSAGVGGQVDPNSADKIMGNGFTAADGKAAINSGATDRVGDCITLIGDGVDGWFIDNVMGTWAREA